MIGWWYLFGRRRRRRRHPEGARPSGQLRLRGLLSGIPPANETWLTSQSLTFSKSISAHGTPSLLRELTPFRVHRQHRLGRTTGKWSHKLPTPSEVRLGCSQFQSYLVRLGRRGNIWRRCETCCPGTLNHRGQRLLKWLPAHWANLFRRWGQVRSRLSSEEAPYSGVVDHFTTASLECVVGND